jgi:hypothetical protein
MLYGHFFVQKSDSGFLEAHITQRRAGWLVLSTEHLSAHDFSENNTAMVKYSIDPMRIKSRYAQETVVMDDGTDSVSVDIIFKRPLPFRTWLEKVSYRLHDEGEILVDNQCDVPIFVEVFCKDSFVRFEARQYRVMGQEKIPFSIKMSALQSAQMLFRKQPSLATEIELRAFFRDTSIKKNLSLRVGEW